jgi:hypothetical protein
LLDGRVVEDVDGDRLRGLARVRNGRGRIGQRVIGAAVDGGDVKGPSTSTAVEVSQAGDDRSEGPDTFALHIGLANWILAWPSLPDARPRRCWGEARAARGGGHQNQPEGFCGFNVGIVN